MTKFERLVQQYCPDGVKWVKLGEVGEFENIGVDKKSLPDEQEVTLLNYMDIYHNKYITPDIPKMIVTANDKKRQQCTVEEGDIFITPSSETIDDIGHSALVLETIPNTVYSYHIMRYRLHNINMTTCRFINYLFESDIIQRQIDKVAQGLTRFGVSKYKFADMEIPLPPLPIQEKIVEILDKFSMLSSELQAELGGRKKQYEYYRTRLLSFDKNADNVQWKTLGEVAHFRRGSFPQPYGLAQWYDGEGAMPFVQVADVEEEGFKLKPNTNRQISKLAQPLSVFVPNGTVIVTLQGSIGKVAVTQYDCYMDRTLALFDKYYLNINKKYFAYQLAAKFAIERETARGGTIKTITKEEFTDFLIPIPPLSEQERIVTILDKFEALVTDLSQGLPAEIQKVQQQYEYYRNLLLNFEK